MRYLTALAALACLAACERPAVEPGTSNNAPGSERGRDSMRGTEPGNAVTPDYANSQAPAEPTP